MPTLRRCSLDTRSHDRQESGKHDAYTIGNAVDDGNRNLPKGWFVGHFVGDDSGLRRTSDLEVKWGEHQAGEEKTSRHTNEHGTTLTLLISGRFVVRFPHLDVEVVLERPGDYVIFAPRIEHRWLSESASVVVTFRWPSAARHQPRLGESKPASTSE
jgi:hypothetical protein